MGLNGCCCCFSLQTGVIILSVLEAIGGVFYIASGFSVTVTGMRVAYILHGIFAVVAGVLGIVAVKKKNANLLVPLMVANILVLVQNVLYGIGGKPDKAETAAWIAILVLASIFPLYFFAVIYYYYKSLRIGGRTINRA